MLRRVFVRIDPRNDVLAEIEPLPADFQAVQGAGWAMYILHAEDGSELDSFTDLPPNTADGEITGFGTADDVGRSFVLAVAVVIRENGVVVRRGPLTKANFILDRDVARFGMMNSRRSAPSDQALRGALTADITELDSVDWPIAFNNRMKRLWVWLPRDHPAFSAVTLNGVDDRDNWTPAADADAVPLNYEGTDGALYYRSVNLTADNDGQTVTFTL